MPDLNVPMKFSGPDLPDDEGYAAIVGILLDTALVFATCNFAAFQKFGIRSAMAEPADPEVAEAFRVLTLPVMLQLMAAHQVEDCGHDHH